MKLLTHLQSLHLRRGFAICDTPADGDCLFSAICLQLESLGIQQRDKKDLRQELVKYMELNPMVTDDLHYRDFLSNLQHQHDDNDILNADTERPDEEDYEISALEDLATQAEL